MIYITGISDSDRILVGGVWRLYHECGFPVESSHMICKENGLLVDWMDAMVDASTDNNLPALVRQMESFIPEKEMAQIKLSYCASVINTGKDPCSVLALKKSKVIKL